MAVTLAIVSFSCTGPILGGLLGSTALAEGDVATNLSMGMTGFGVALALPFGLFALFLRLNSFPNQGMDDYGESDPWVLGVGLGF